jgi:hypothetical protein
MALRQRAPGIGWNRREHGAGLAEGASEQRPEGLAHQRGGIETEQLARGTVGALHHRLVVEKEHRVGEGVERRLPFARRLGEQAVRRAGAQQRPHGRDEHRGVDGMGEVGVGTLLQPASAVGVRGVARRQMQHGDERTAGIAAQLLHDVEAGHVGEIHVEHDDVGVGLHGVERLPSRRRLVDVEPRRAEDAGRGVAVRLGVVDDEHARSLTGRLSHAPPPRAGCRAARRARSAIPPPVRSGARRCRRAARRACA